ncbi:MAG: hypothetical protein BJ554DRAFT_4640 [Olpidium bornovanus]|uniref:Uncharacterized protein n=1 Tax=Olpidium bornovanus TaxID=278681 RepID=A0A8H7ZMT1_9FUNG|nr:MAG: hypothetical protein BJ554DRAFT_4640 [Olpidium bornovanus]
MALHRRARMLHQLLASISATFSDCRHKDPPDLRSGALMPGGPAAGVAWLNRLPRSWAGVPFDAVGCAVFAKVGRDSRPEKQGGTSSSSPEKPGGKDPQLRRAGSSAGDEGIVILLAMLQSTVTAQIQKQIQGVRQKLSKCKTGPNKSRANSANYDDAGASYNLLLATIEKELSASPRRTCASADFAAGDTPEQTAADSRRPRGSKVNEQTTLISLHFGKAEDVLGIICPLQLLNFNEEFLVSATHQLALITSLPFVHTARRYYRISSGYIYPRSRAPESKRRYAARNKVTMVQVA